MPLKTWPKPFKYFKDVKTFFISLSVIIAFFAVAIFAFLYHSTNTLLLQIVKEQAASYAQLIILTRNWNAGYGGVYIEKKPGIDTNPYLKKLGVEADVKTADGRTLTLRNPAIMIRELSRLTKERNSVQFHMISLRYINAENAPDAFEREALKQFEHGLKEVWGIDRTEHPPLFRYILPLPIEEPCLKCHGTQGYDIGGIRGGISVTIPVNSLDIQMSRNRLTTIVLSVMTIGLLLSILYFLTWKLVVKLDEMQNRLKEMAITDELTGLKNRRYILEHLEEEYQRAVRTGEPLSLIMLDLDHFKQINDTYGHAFGDLVLKKVADDMKTSLRSYDLLGRLGGEEFLIASPGSGREDTAGLAERILKKIKSEKIGTSAIQVGVTLSAGITVLNANDHSAEAVLRRADAALYRAKQEGRDRVVVM